MTSLRSEARRAIVARRERAYATPARFAAPAATTLVTAVAFALVLAVAGSPLLVVAGVVTAVVLVATIANHRMVSSLSAGLGLLLIRPYQPGERVRLFSPELGEVAEAEVVRIGLLNTTLASSSGLFVVANTWMLRAAPQCRS